MKKSRHGRGGMNFLFILSSILMVLMMMASTTTAKKCYVCHSEVDKDCGGQMKDKYLTDCDKDFRKKVWGEGNITSLSEICQGGGGDPQKVTTPEPITTQETPGGRSGGGDPPPWLMKEQCDKRKTGTDEVKAKYKVTESPTTTGATNPAPNPQNGKPEVKGMVQEYMANELWEKVKVGKEEKWQKRKNPPLPAYDACKVIVSQLPKDLRVKGIVKPQKKVVIRTCGWTDKTMDAKKWKATVGGNECIWREYKHPGDSNNRMCTCTGDGCNKAAGKEGLVPPGMLLILVLLASNLFWTFGF